MDTFFKGRIPLDTLEEMRPEVLQVWPAGVSVNLEETVEFLANEPRRRNLALRMLEAKEKGETLVQPRGGRLRLEEHLRLLQSLEQDGGADILPTTLDNRTRMGRFQELETELHSSGENPDHGTGFPVVNHGVMGGRYITSQVGLPVQVRHVAVDARLVAETAIAGGFTGIEGGGISVNIPYLKDMPLERSIALWQYVDRLAGLMGEKGVPIHREPFGGFMGGALLPPCLSHSIGILEGLLAAEQGVQHLSLGYMQTGNLLQDLAGLLTLLELGREYFHRMGYPQVVLTTVFHQWMGGLPQDESRAYAVIVWGAVTAALGGANKIMVRSPRDATGFPGVEAINAGLKASKQSINMVKQQQQAFGDHPGLEEEKELLRVETRSILDKVLELGEGNVAAGVVEAFNRGVIDIPFSTSRINAGRVLPVRDIHGAVRLLEPGNLPLPSEVLAIHAFRVKERGRQENRAPSFQMVLDDIYAIGKGMLRGK
ncbi:MAG: methylaspartate mutase subunit E [Bacillota bacterium]